MLRTFPAQVVLFALLALPFPLLAEVPNRPGNLLATSKRARLDIVAGRIGLTHISLGRHSVQCLSDTETGTDERLSFSAGTSESAQLSYQYRDADQQWNVDIEQFARVHIERLPCGDSGLVAVRLRQPLEGDLVLCVEDDHCNYEISGKSFWHLVLAEPEICETYLVPILQSLRTDWPLGTQIAQVEAALMAAARRGRLPDTDRMGELVRQLGYSEFSRRQAAHRELREMGQSAASFLKQLDEGCLQVEQRTRLRQIRQSLQLNTSDTPLRVASWLSDDKVVWLSLLEREELTERQLAARHLERIAGHTLAFDPTASPAARRGQIHRLRAQWDIEYPLLVGDAGGDLRR